VSGQDFAAAFWRHLEQPLRNLCLGHARCIVANAEGWLEAYHSIWAYAVSRGALHLSNSNMLAIREWIDACLLDEIARAEHERWDLWPRNPENMGVTTNG
jgi:hypothetical protein